MPDIQRAYEFDMRRGVTYRGAYAAPEHALMQLLLDYGKPVELRTAERELGIRPLKEHKERSPQTRVVRLAPLSSSGQSSWAHALNPTSEV